MVLRLQQHTHTPRSSSLFLQIRPVELALHKWHLHHLRLHILPDLDPNIRASLVTPILNRAHDDILPTQRRTRKPTRDLSNTIATFRIYNLRPFAGC
jgi:hypothetical protein